MDLKQIIADIKAGKLTRENDETNAGGFWDYTYWITEELNETMMMDDYQDLVEELYNELWDVYDITKSKQKLVYGIVWCQDHEDGIDDADLPDEVLLPDIGVANCHCGDLQCDENVESVNNYLSDKFGFCVENWSIREL